METATIAAVQATPVFFDRDATIEHVAELTKEAAGARRPARRVLGGLRADLSRLGVADRAVEQRRSRVVRALVSTRRSTSPARRATRSARSRGSTSATSRSR